MNNYLECICVCFEFLVQNNFFYSFKDLQLTKGKMLNIAVILKNLNF